MTTIEQRNLTRLITEYPGHPFWMDLYRECGSILDNFAKICYNRMLTAYGIEPGSIIAIPKDFESSFGHLVLSHSFMEFTMLTGLRYYAKRNAEGGNEDFVNRMDRIERPMYDRFCEVNKVPEELTETGWKEYLED